ncbi:dual serine/threonine and tyrosine protein kinase-like isoform X2 [Tachypleus tridentatus]|uniref:dual serine/threonine and tyrosine protein kinase-like isoform X2 n=1 Tax=Tachypleus tridentatus TaxID=6853 RepID=UPI003FD11554
MADGLVNEFINFNKNCRHLLHILKDTKKYFAEIQRSGYLDNSELEFIGLSAENEDIIEGIVHQPLGIVILGNSCSTKVEVVNQLFGQALLPTVPSCGDNGEDKIHRRMIRLSYGNQTEISLALSDDYELIHHVAVPGKPFIKSIACELELKDEDNISIAVLEIKLKHSLLQANVKVIVSPSTHQKDFTQEFQQCVTGVTPIFIYCYSEETLSEKEVTELLHLKKLAPTDPVFFICSKSSSTWELTESEQHTYVTQSSSHRRCRRYSCQEYHSPHHFPIGRRRGESVGSKLQNVPLTVYQQLCALGFLNLLPCRNKDKLHKSHSDQLRVESELVEQFENFSSILLFVHRILQFLLIRASSLLNNAHNNCLRTFILAAFDMTWDLMMTPKRIEFARKHEADLYSSLMAVASKKQDEIRDLIVTTVSWMREDLLEKAADWKFQSLCICEVENVSYHNIQICTSEIQQLVLDSLNCTVAEKLVGSLSCLQDCYVGTLERCLSSLEKHCNEESSCRASNSLRQILNAAYQVDVTVDTSASLLRTVFFKMKQLFQAMPWKSTSKIDSEWKKNVALEILNNISESRLARSICNHFCERLKKSHNQFSAALRNLEELHSGRLQRNEELKLRVRKTVAPKIARCALESKSLIDVIAFGMPQLKGEIGRGQFGIVYSCETWGAYSPCAVKTVVPPDNRHWNDLAMEFFYTSIPDHKRVVQIKGSVIDHNYGGGQSPAVLLIMERLQQDLFQALKMGLDIFARLQIGLDVVEGIRFLHSQGLIHRDIKLKNVLLDARNKAKITDLGFCKPEAMISGSIVGTPIHMAPELFTGHYDSSVDVYAFGILFWYLCAGDIKMPYIFEQCQTKDRLFDSVVQGARPERLPQFSDDSWKLMCECWATDPKRRPFLGEVEPRLKSIMDFYNSNSPIIGNCNQSKQFVHPGITEPVFYSELLKGAL